MDMFFNAVTLIIGLLIMYYVVRFGVKHGVMDAYEKLQLERMNAAASRSEDADDEEDDLQL